MSSALKTDVDRARASARARVEPQARTLRRAIITWPITIVIAYGLAWLFAGWPEPWPIVGGFVAVVGSLFFVAGGFAIATNVTDVLAINEAKEFEVSRLSFLLGRKERDRREKQAVS